MSEHTLSSTHLATNALTGKAIVFIGGGNMAGALIEGLLTLKQQGGDFDIRVCDQDQNKLDAFAKKGVRTSLPSDVQSVITGSDIVVLAVKPQVMADVTTDIGPYITDQLIISIAAGLSLAKLQAMTGKSRVVRTMPNLPATVGLGATGLYADLDDTDKALATAVMGASGVTVWVAKEDDLHTVTAVAGSAPAYFFYFLEAMIAKAVSMGLDADDAKRLAVATMHGAAVMAYDEDPNQLRAKVTSKGGTTHAAIVSMQTQLVDTLIGDAMQACYDRSVELGE